MKSAGAGSRLPAIDGIRGISAWFVVFAHLGVLPRPFGALGVSIFFVLSGFLITYLLLGEHEKTGTISLKNFYIRRTLRIFPAFYVFLGLTLAICAVAGIQLSRTQAIADAVYMGDYGAALGVAGPILGIAWSLGIEEKFYLLWPWAFFRHRDTTHKLIQIAATICAACWVYRAVMWFGVGVSADYLRYAFESRLDGIMFGCLAAVAYNSAGLRAVTARPVYPVLAATALVGITASPWIVPNYDYSIGITLNAALTVCALVGFIRHSERFRWLDSAPMRFLGNISYSTYLYHILVIGVITEVYPNLKLRILFPACILLTLALAWASQVLIEQPFLRLKKRYEVRPLLRAEATAKR